MQAPRWVARFDCFLAKRLWLPGLVQMATADGAHDMWLGEPAQDTLRGLFERLNAMVERLAPERWNAGTLAGTGRLRTLVAPERAWRLPPGARH